jgi:plasmid stabilization system protein ParE
MSYELLLVPRAEAEVERILHYLVERSLAGAKAWCERWEYVLAELRNDPLKYGFAPESKQWDIEIHQILFRTRHGRTYRAIFTIVGRGVYILSVRGPSQNLVRRKSMRRRS